MTEWTVRVAGSQPGYERPEARIGDVSSKTLNLKRLMAVCLLIGLCMAGTSGCTSQDPALTQPSTNGPLAVESFTGTLAKTGTAFYSFTVPRDGAVSLTLLSLTIGGVPSDLSITMGLGVPRGTGCQTSTQIGVTAGVAPQVTNPVVPSVYCVNLNDTGTLTADAAFAVSISRPR